MMRNGNGLQVRPAEWPRDLATVKQLFESYFRSLADDPAVPAAIRTRERKPELDGVMERYGAGSSSLLLAFADEQVCGCAAVIELAEREHAAEMKRLYVLPDARGRGVGRALILACATWAREHDARELLLDTLPEAMPGAVRLYRSLGFEPTERYNENEGCCFAFFRLGLE